jgi:RNA polymerase sigma-70 factor (ECF subfamily)
MSKPVATDGEQLVTAAQRGDETAFRELVETYRRELHAHCYRMTASLDDADDMVQEVMLRAWRGLPGFEGRSSIRSWLYRIATNVCLTEISKRPRRVLPADVGEPGHEASGEPVWITPYPDQTMGIEDGPASPEGRYELRESIELAFIAALQHLPANQRAALILRDVLGFRAREVADALETTTAAVNSALQHARRTVETRVPDRSQQAALRSLGDDRLRAIVSDYTAALEEGDVDAIVSMLAEDATWSMPPHPEWYQGHQAIVEFFATGPAMVRWRHIPTTANGQIAVGCYAWNAEAGVYQGAVIDVLTLRGSQIAAITAFIDSGLFARFGLPEVVSA